MARIRVGVALLLPDALSAEIQGLRRGVEDPALERIPPHLTLVPPVNVREDRLDDVLAILRQAASRTSAFRITLGPPDSFLPTNPVLYLPVAEGVGDILKLRERVFVAPLARSLTWPFVPHVTLADGADPERIDHARRALAGYRVATDVDAVHLLREEEDRKWRPLATVPFAGIAVIGRGGLPLEIARSPRLDPPARAFAERAWSAFDRDEMGVETGAQPARRDMTFTARRAAEVVGVAVGRVESGVGYLSELIVDPAVRGEGVGHHLLAAFESWVAGEGVTRLALRTLAGSPAEGFYRRRGWQEEARLADWHFGRTFVQLRRDLA